MYVFNSDIKLPLQTRDSGTISSLGSLFILFVPPNDARGRVSLLLPRGGGGKKKKRVPGNQEVFFSGRNRAFGSI